VLFDLGDVDVARPGVWVRCDKRSDHSPDVDVLQVAELANEVKMNLRHFSSHSAATPGRWPPRPSEDWVENQLAFHDPAARQPFDLM